MRLTKLHISTIIVTMLLSAIVGYMLWLTPQILKDGSCVVGEWMALVAVGIGAVAWVAKTLSVRPENGNGHQGGAGFFE